MKGNRGKATGKGKRDGEMGEGKRKKKEGRRTELRRRAVKMKHSGVDTTRINKLLKAPNNKSNIAKQKTAWFSVRECLCLTEKFEVIK